MQDKKDEQYMRGKSEKLARKALRRYELKRDYRLGHGHKEIKKGRKRRGKKQAK